MHCPPKRYASKLCAAQFTCMFCLSTPDSRHTHHLRCRVTTHAVTLLMQSPITQLLGFSPLTRTLHQPTPTRYFVPTDSQNSDLLETATCKNPGKQNSRPSHPAGPQSQAWEIPVQQNSTGTCIRRSVTSAASYYDKAQESSEHTGTCTSNAK